MGWTSQNWGPQSTTIRHGSHRRWRCADIAGFSNEGFGTVRAHQGACDGTRLTLLRNGLLLTSSWILYAQR